MMLATIVEGGDSGYESLLPSIDFLLEQIGKNIHNRDLGDD